jgi:hypothetical protein
MSRGFLVGVLLLLVGCAGPTSPSPGADASPGLATFHEQGLDFDYPPSWRIFRYDEVSSFSNLIAYFATVDVGDPCTRTANSVSCGQSYTLLPDSIVVSLHGGGFLGFNVLDGRPPGAIALVAGGLPAYVERLAPADRAAGADVSQRWMIARPGSVSSYYSIQADIKGPDLADQLRRVEALVASLQFDPPVVPLDAGRAAAEHAASKALATMASTDPSWACFPGEPGVRQMRITSMVSGPVLAKPQIATCSTRIEPTRLQLWRLTLIERLPEPDPQAGSELQVVLWVSPDGTPGEMTSGSPEP